MSRFDSISKGFSWLNIHKDAFTLTRVISRDANGEVERAVEYEIESDGSGCKWIRFKDGDHSDEIRLPAKFANMLLVYATLVGEKK